MLLAAGYFWLLIPDAGGWQVGGSLLLAAAIVFLALWLPAGTLAYFRIAELREHATVWPAYRRALRHLLPFAIWMIALVVVVLVLTKLRIYPPQFGVWFRQKMPGSLRGGMSPRSVMHAADWLLWFLLWVVLPAFWLPVASTVAATGFRREHVDASLRVLKRPLFWIALVATLLIGVYLPLRLIHWIPDADTLGTQAWSMGLRFFVAYILCVSAWIALAWVVGLHTEGEDSDAATLVNPVPASRPPESLDNPIATS